MIAEGITLIEEVFSDMLPCSRNAFRHSLEHNRNIGRREDCGNSLRPDMQGVPFPMRQCSDVQGRLANPSSDMKDEELLKMATDVEIAAAPD